MEHTTADGNVCSITIRGTLVRDAEARISAGPEPRAYIYADVRTGERDEPVHVRWCLPGLGYVPQVSAKAKAAALRKGTQVYVRAGGIVAAPFGRLCARDVEWVHVVKPWKAAGAAADRVAPNC